MCSIAKKYMFISILLISPCFYLCQAHANCSIELNISADEGIESTTILVRERPNTNLDVSNENGIQTVVFSDAKQDELYKIIDITVTPSAGERASYSYYSLFPCKNRTHTIITGTRIGNESEVREMWDNRDYEVPDTNDLDIIKRQYSNALGTALKRHEIMIEKRHTPHQYDLISTYLALRAFNNLVSASDPPLAWNEQINKIADWHIELMKTVSRKNLGTIFREKTLASKMPSITKMYKSYWNDRILACENEKEKFRRILKFRHAIEAEEQSNYILTRLRLSQNELYSSTMDIAGKLSREELSDDETLTQLTSSVNEAITYTQSQKNMANDSPSINKIFKDTKYLNSKYKLGLQY